LPRLKSALRIRQTHGFSFWDRACPAAALNMRCGSIYTEDLTHGQFVERIAMIRPFRG
jgi:predicted nucleic acid-binding protein